MQKKKSKAIIVIVIAAIIVIILFCFKSRKLNSLYAGNISDIEQVSIVSGGTGDIAVVRNAEDIERLVQYLDRKSTRLNSSHTTVSRMPSSA